MSLRTTSITLSTMALVAGLAAAVPSSASVATTADAHDPSIAPTADSRGSSSQLGLLSEPRSDADRLPGYLSASQAGVRESSTRLVGATENATYWAATNDRNEYCMISVLAGDAWTAGTTCATPSEFANSGVSAQVVGPSTAAEAYLVPDGHRVARADGAYQIAPNLAIGDPYRKGAGTIAAESTAGRSTRIRLSNLPEPTHRGRAQSSDTSSQPTHESRDVGTASIVDFFPAGGLLAPNTLHMSALEYSAVGGESAVSTMSAKVTSSTWQGGARKHAVTAVGSVLMNHALVPGARPGCEWTSNIGPDPAPTKCKVYDTL